jgi:arsenite methyltransferase
MTAYLGRTFGWTTPEFVAVFDEAPLWSAVFGKMLFDRAPLRRDVRLLDIGCGAGFPLLDLAQRLGPTCRARGLDGWHAGLQRARQKIAGLHVTNTVLVEGDGAAIPFASSTFDLVVTNLGINNFASPEAVLVECARVTRPGAVLALTTNLRGHMQTFYDIYGQTLRDLGRAELLPALQAHIDHRLTVEAIAELLDRAGFSVFDVHRDSLTLRYLDGSAFFNHAFIQTAFLESWREFLPPSDERAIFERLEANLNAEAAREGELRLVVPMAYIGATRKL